MMANFHYRLLVVDDEPAIRYLFQSSLTTEGYEVGVAKDGFAALAQMRGALPDLILTDLKMPNMSGFELLSIVRRRFPHENRFRELDGYLSTSERETRPFRSALQPNQHRRHRPSFRAVRGRKAWKQK